MKIKRGLGKLSSLFESAVVVLISSLFVISIVFAATTIGSNILTDGNLDVNGTASTTSATSTAYIDIGVRPDGGVTLVNWAGGDLYVQDDIEVDDDANIADLLTLGRATTTRITSTAAISVGSFFTSPAGFDFTEDLAVSGDIVGNNKVTSTVALWVGSAGTANNINLAGGDLYVQDDAEIDDLLTSGSATTTSATSTAYLWVGYPLSNPTGFDYAQDLAVSDDVLIGGQSTSTVSLWIGSAGTANNINLAGGDLYVQDDAEIDDLLTFSRATSTSATTTAYLMVGSDFTLPSVFNYSEDLSVSGDTVLNDLYVVGGSATVSTGTATTTLGLLVGPTQGIGTTTLSVGVANNATSMQNGCIEMVKNGVYSKIYINENGTALVVTVGRCKDGP